MAKLTINVVNEQVQPLSGVAATLTGDNPVEPKLTNAAGQVEFPDLAPGRYTLLTARGGLNVRSTSITMDDADKTLSVTMRVADEDAQAARGRLFFFIKDGLQILLLIGVAVLFSIVIYKGVANVKFGLDDDSTARGLITFLVAVVTVGIALILVLAAILGGGKDLDKRLGFGKEVFAILIGVLGTIMGFYYGQAVKAGTEAGRQAAITASSPVAVSPEQLQQLNQTFRISTALTNGKPPYTYSFKFTPDAVVPADNLPAENQTSKDGKISREFKLKPEAQKGATLNFILEVQDANGATFTFDNDKEGKKLVIPSQ